MIDNRTKQTVAVMQVNSAKVLTGALLELMALAPTRPEEEVPEYLATMLQEIRQTRRDALPKSGMSKRFVYLRDLDE